MNILLLCPRFPLPAVKGDKLRAHQFLRALGAQHELTLLSFVANRREAELVPQLEAHGRVVAVPFRAIAAGLRLGRAGWRPLPAQVLLYESAHIKGRLEALLGDADVVHCITHRMAANLPSVLDKPLVVDFVDALSATYARGANTAGPARRWAYRREAGRLQALERDLCQSAAFTYAISEADAAALGEEVRVLPHAIDMDEFSPPPEDQARSGIVFTGNLQYPPNVDGACEAAREVFPRVRESLQGTTLRIVGIDPNARVRALEGAGITVTGYVPSVAEELRRAAVALAPIRSGGGVKTKVLEAMACATPVVATLEALKGIPAADGREALIVGDEADAARKVIELLSHPARAAEVGAAGRRLVAERFSLKSTNRLLSEWYSELEASLPTGKK